MVELLCWTLVGRVFEAHQTLPESLGDRLPVSLDRFFEAYQFLPESLGDRLPDSLEIGVREVIQGSLRRSSRESSHATEPSRENRKPFQFAFIAQAAEPWATCPYVVDGVDPMLFVSIPGSQSLLPPILSACGVEGESQPGAQGDSEDQVKTHDWEIMGVVGIRKVDGLVSILGIDADLLQKRTSS